MDKKLSEIHRKLCGYGIHQQSAHYLLEKHPADYVEHKINVLEYLLAENTRQISSPAGYLYQSIEQNYTQPVGYKPPSQLERERKRQAEYREKRKQQQRVKQQREAALRRKREKEKVELIITAPLAARMDAPTETRLRKFINEKRPPFLRPCDDYDLRASSIESKPRDYAAGTFFNMLRVQFFKQTCPNAFQ